MNIKLLSSAASVGLAILVTAGCSDKPEKRLNRVFVEGREFFQSKAELEIRRTFGNDAFFGCAPYSTSVFFRETEGKFDGSPTAIVVYRKIGSLEKTREAKLDRGFAEGRKFFQEKAELEIKRALGNDALAGFAPYSTSVFFREKEGKLDGSVIVVFRKIGSVEIVRLSENSTVIWAESIQANFSIEPESDSIYLGFCKDRKFSSQIVYLNKKPGFRENVQTNQ